MVTPSERVTELLEDLSRYLDRITTNAVSSSPLEGYIDVIIPRLRSTYNAVSLLIRVGHLDESLVLIRRQLEDSVRLNWLARNDGDVDAMVVGFDITRMKKVQSSMDRLVNDPSTPGEDVVIIKEARRPRAKEIQRRLQLLKEHGIAPGSIPQSFDQLAKETGRHRDIVVYASASEVSHSAVSGAVQDYVVVDEEGKLTIADLSNNPHSMATYAKSIVTATVTSISSALVLGGRTDDAKALAEFGLQVEQEIIAIRAELQEMNSSSS